MNDKAKIPVVLLVVLFVVSVVLAAGALYLYQQEHAKNITMQKSLDDLNSKQKLTEKSLDSYKKQTVDLKTLVEEKDLEIEKLNGQIEQVSSEKIAAEGQLEILKTDLDQQKADKSDLDAKLSKALEDIRAAQEQLKKIEAEKSSLEAKVKELEAKNPSGQNVELGKIVVSPEAKSDKPLEGKILVVNKEYNFVVINLGANDAVEVGDVFSIYHNNKYIGDAKVEKIHDAMSAAALAVPAIKDKISEGDKVVQKVK